MLHLNCCCCCTWHSGAVSTCSLGLNVCVRVRVRVRVRVCAFTVRLLDCSGVRLTGQQQSANSQPTVCKQQQEAMKGANRGRKVACSLAQLQPANSLNRRAAAGGGHAHLTKREGRSAGNWNLAPMMVFRSSLCVCVSLSLCALCFGQFFILFTRCTHTT